MDQYVSWCLPVEELNLDTFWGKFEEFSSAQSNEVRAQFNLLASFKQGNRIVDEWYNVVQAQVNLAKYPPETAKICTETSSGSSCMMKNFFPKPLMMGMWIWTSSQQAKLDSLQKEWKVQRQLHTISNRWLVTHKQHESTYSGFSAQSCQQENKRKRSPLSSQDNQTVIIMVMRILKCQASTRNGLMSRMPTRRKSGVQSVEIQLMRKAFSALQKVPRVKLVTGLDTLPAFVNRKSCSFQVKEREGTSITSRGSICQRMCYMWSI